MQKFGVQLAAENDVLEHYFYVGAQAIYSGGVWLRKISDEMFEHSKSFRKSVQSDAASTKIISSLIDRIIMEGFRVANFTEMLDARYDTPLKETYSDGASEALPALSETAILICHAFLRIVQCFPEMLAESPQEEHEYETCERTGTPEIKVHNFYRVLLFCFNVLNSYSKKPPADMESRMLLAPALRRAVMILGQFQSLLLSNLVPKGKKKKNDDGMSSGNAAEKAFALIKEELAESIYDCLKYCHQTVETWGTFLDAALVVGFLNMATAQMGDRIKEQSTTAGVGSDWGSATAQESSSSSTRKRKREEEET